MEHHYSYGQHGYPFQGEHSPIPTNMHDQYLNQSIQSLIGYYVVVQTPRGSVRGVLFQVFPDHIVLQVSDHHYFIRLQQVIWVMPQHRLHHQHRTEHA